MIWLFRFSPARVLVTIVSPFISILSVHAQVNDAAVWENIYIEKSITAKWNIHLNHEGRINQNITRPYYGYLDGGITYKLNKHIHLMADYVFLEKRLKTDNWSMRHQAYVALTLKQKIGSFSFSDRIMPQVQYNDYYSTELGKLPDYQLRNKVTIKYNNMSRFTYYVACEVNYKLNPYYKKSTTRDGGHFERLRYFAGLFYELNKVNELELYYLIEQHFNVPNPLTNYVIGIGFAHVIY